MSTYDQQKPIKMEERKESEQTSSTQNQTQISEQKRPERASRQTNLERIRQVKQAQISQPIQKKLLKLSNYSKCQVSLLYLIIEGLI